MWYIITLACAMSIGAIISYTVDVVSRTSYCAGSLCVSPEKRLHSTIRSHAFPFWADRRCGTSTARYDSEDSTRRAVSLLYGSLCSWMPQIRSKALL